MMSLEEIKKELDKKGIIYPTSIFNNTEQEIREIYEASKEAQASQQEVIIDLSNENLSPSYMASASRSKKIYLYQNQVVYYKYELTKNEIFAEVFAYLLGSQLGLNMAKVELARYKETEVIISYDIGQTKEVEEYELYSIKKYEQITGFIEMCLFDYVIMNEDRHIGNWTVLLDREEVAPLYDHNHTFGGEQELAPTHENFRNITSAFCVESDYDYFHDKILEYLYRKHKEKVEGFIKKIEGIEKIEHVLLEQIDAKKVASMNKLLQKRIADMKRSVKNYE